MTAKKPEKQYYVRIGGKSVGILTANEMLVREGFTHFRLHGRTTATFYSKDVEIQEKNHVG